MLPYKFDEESFVFDLVKNKNKFLEDPVYAAEEIKRIGRKITRTLDGIQKKAEIPIHITFHMSRHTFATNALNNGMRIEHVSKIMDHSSIKITEGYAKVINSELDKSMEQYIY